MRTLPTGMAVAITGGATTFCRCWRLARADGFVLGFTDHDIDLSVSGTLYRADSGMEGTEAESVLGLAIAGSEINGVLRSDAIVESDIASGLWDAAEISMFLVDWSNPSEFILLEKGVAGEIRRTDFGFTVELRSASYALDQPRGRLFQAACSADLGDARCGIQFGNPLYRADATISGGDGRLTLDTDGLSGFADGWFSGGSITFTSGANLGARADVKQHKNLDGPAEIGLWAPLAQPLAVGDGFTILAGCDKSFVTCRDRFANLLNFRGFPFMPGNDLVLGTIRTGESGLTGGSLRA